MSTDQGEALADGADGFERDVIAFVIEMLEALPGQSIEELAEECSRQGFDLGPGALRHLMIGQIGLFEVKRQVWWLQSPSRPQPAVQAPAPGPARAPQRTQPSVRSSRPPLARFGGPLDVPDAADGTPEALERELRDRMRGRRLAAEVELDAALLERAHDGLERLVAARMTSLEVARRYPALLVTYLVGHGVYHYSPAGFWNTITVKGIDGSWAQAFEESLQRLELETFEDMVFGDNALRYVGPILAHGGIPRYCLPDYFRLLIRHLKRSADADDLLASWRTRRTTFVGIDVPVRRFLLYGGDLAADFIDRSIDLVRETSRTGVAPRPSEVGLPPYVVTAFRRFLDSDKPSLDRNPVAAPIARPAIKLDPWGPSGVTLHLPALANAKDGWAWRLHADGQFDRFDASRFAGREISLRPARGWTVDLLDGTQALQDMAFEGLDELPALFFDPRTGELVRPASGLRYKEIWVMSPAETELIGVAASGAEVDLRVPEELPDPTGPWSGYRLRTVDLDGLRALGVREAPSAQWRRLTVRPVAERPTVLGEPLAAVASGVGAQVFAEAPDVLLPAGSWLVRVSVDGELLPPQAVEATEPKALALEVGPGCHDVGLVVRGALGADLRTRFAVVDGLSVERSDRLLFPGDRSDSVKVQGAALSVDGGVPGDAATVDIPRDGDEGWCEVSDLDGRAVRLGVRVSKVLWSVGRAGQDEVRWGQDPAVLAADEIGGTSPASLLVRTGVHDLPLQLDLTDGRSTLQQSDKVRSAGADGRWQFDLGRFAQTISRTDAPLLSLELWVGKRPVSVAKVRQTLEITNLKATSRVTGDFTQVDLTFNEGRVLENRVARLWPVTRPWEPPVIQPVPRDESGHVGIGGFGRIGAGLYLAEIAVDDGWTAAIRPNSTDARCTLVQVGTDEDLRARLSRDVSPSAHDVLESMLITGRGQRMLLPADLAEVGPDVVDVVVRMSNGELGRYDSSSPGFRAIQRALTSAPELLVEAVIAYAERRPGGGDELLRLAIEFVREYHPSTEASLPAGTARAFWQVAPVLAAAHDLRGPLDPDRSARVNEFAGWDPRGEGPASGGPVTQLYIGLPADQMASLQHTMDLVPGPTLSQDELVAAHFEWLLADKASPGLAEHWWRTHRRSIRREAVLTPMAEQHLRSRQPPAGTVEWAAMPELVLQAAIEVVSATTGSDLAVRALWAAATFAPRLVTHDLVLAQVLQRWPEHDHTDLDEWTYL